MVSVIIPTYSRPDYITRAIESALTQTCGNVEVIVVDDNGSGSKFQIETEQLLQKYINNKSITYITHDVNKNGSAARNTGFWASHGEYVTFLDDDDVMLPQKLEKQITAIEQAGGNVAAAYCGCKIVRHEKVIKETSAKHNGNFGKAMLQGKWGVGSGSNLLLKREAVERINGYDESFKRRQDLEFAIRFFRHYDIVAVNETLLIKYNDAPTKRPDPRKYIAIEEHFLESFKEDIEKMPLNDARKVYFSSFYKMALSSANARDFDFMLQMLKKATCYKKLSLKEILRLIHNYVSRPTVRK